MAHYELPVAKFANLTPRLLTIGVNFTVREHALLIETILTVALSTKLAEKHLCVRFEDVITTADARSRGYFLTRRPRKLKDRIIIVEFKLMAADTHIIAFTSQTV